MSFSDIDNPVQVDRVVADAVRAHERVRPVASLTNYFPGDPGASNPMLPAVTSTTWAIIDGAGNEIVVLHEDHDENGCRHWVPGPQERP